MKKLRVSKWIYKLSTLNRSLCYDVVEMSYGDALSMLNDFSAEPLGSCVGENTIVSDSDHLYDLQIIIPVYNVNQYLEECINSVLNQNTKYSFVVILVDDGSSDGSEVIVDKYSQHENVKVIHEANGGVSAARNAGLHNIYARYLTFVDSDDRLRQGAIESMLNIAYAHDADIVEGGMVGFKGNYYSKTIISRDDAPICYSELSGFACGKIFKNYLWNNVVFPEGFWFEDSVYSFILFPKATNCWGTSNVTYEYRSNPFGFTKNFMAKPKSIDTFWITNKLMEERKLYELKEDAAYISKLRKQFVLNDQRTRGLPENIRKAVFYLSSLLFVEVYERNLESCPSETDKLVYEIMRRHDYYKFVVAAKWVL